MTKEKRISPQLTSENVCELYSLLHKEGIVSFPLTSGSIHKIESLIENINGSNFGIENYPTPELKVVAYLYFLIKDHPFTDGNKRTAALTFLVACALNELKPNLDGFTLDALVVYLESRKDTDHHLLIEVLSELFFPKN